MEQLLHYVWKHKIFPLTPLQTTSGLPVEVIDTGLQNTHAGPDFFNAKLKIDGTLWVGNVEIHTTSSDWYRHGHDHDKAYDSVILHVVEQADCEVFCSNGGQVSQLLLVCPEHVKQHYEELHASDIYPPCYSVLSALPKLTIHSWLSALQTERFQQKADVIAKRLHSCNNNWEDAFFITLARNFGFGLNGDAFETWANLIPFRAVDKHRDDLTQIEAFFFGQAGLLEEDATDDYQARMQNEFRYLQHKFELSAVMDNALWRFLRIRPGNFPHVRLAQLAALYQEERSLFSRVMAAMTLKEIRQILIAKTSPYWESHFIFGKSSPQKEKGIGAGAQNLLVINTVVPFLYAYGLHKADERLCDRATDFLEELKAENNYVTRLWSGAGLPVHTAADSQALLQLQKEYCDKKKCLYCRFGYEYLRKK